MLYLLFLYKLILDYGGDIYLKYNAFISSFYK